MVNSLVWVLDEQYLCYFDLKLIFSAFFFLNYGAKMAKTNYTAKTPGKQILIMSKLKEIEAKLGRGLKPNNIRI